MEWNSTERNGTVIIIAPVDPEIVAKMPSTIQVDKFLKQYWWEHVGGPRVSFGLASLVLAAGIWYELYGKKLLGHE
jgi:hypothetical protein